MSSLLDTLTANLPEKAEIVPQPPQELGPALSVKEKIIVDTEEDVEFARKNLKQLITESNESLKGLMALAESCENPRAFEVLSNMMKNTADMVGQLLDIQKKRKEITQSKELDTPAGTGTVGGTTTNNTTVFVGSSMELQRMIADSMKVAEKV